MSHTKHHQLKLDIQHQPQPDRNAASGGRSFYFFDFDDNVMFLPTPIYLFEKESRREHAVSTGHFAKIHGLVGKPGAFEEMQLDLDDQAGSFRRFRDQEDIAPGSGSQNFVSDMRAALRSAPFEWKGPSWDFFLHAVVNKRPISIITARGHHPETLKRGITELVHQGYLPHQPHYQSIFPVSHPPTQTALSGTDGTRIVAELKKLAIIQAVEDSFEHYGENPDHRFGMSDDDPKNIALVIEAMVLLKKRYPHNAFFVIDASQDPVIHTEVLADHTEVLEMSRSDQLRLF